MYFKFQKIIKNKVHTCLQTINWEMSENHFSSLFLHLTTLSSSLVTLLFKTRNILSYHLPIGLCTFPSHWQLCRLDHSASLPNRLSADYCFASWSSHPRRLILGSFPLYQDLTMRLIVLSFSSAYTTSIVCCV
jgi:hypothetical protein